MSPLSLAFIFFALGVVLLIADLLVPSHAVLTVLGVVALLIGVGFCFAVSTRLGFLTLALLVVASPVALMAALRVWPHTPVGRRMTLTSAVSGTSPSPVSALRTLRPGDTATTLTPLRPTGMIRLDTTGERVEATSDAGLIPPNTPVTIASLTAHIPTVRPTGETPSPL